MALELVLPGGSFAGVLVSEPWVGFDLDLSAGRQGGTGTALTPSKPGTERIEPGAAETDQIITRLFFLIFRFYLFLTIKQLGCDHWGP